jgi:hypothetical protein
MYGTSEKKELQENSKQFEVGITNNVVLTEVKAYTRTTKKGEQFAIDFILTNSDGGVHTHIEWEADSDSKMLNQNKRLRRWVKEITGTDSFGNSFTSWEECANSFIRSLGNYSSVKLQIKLLYNDKGYLEMPKYDPTVKNMSEPTLSISKSEEPNLVKPTVASTQVDDLPTTTANLDF